jgi:hypothetical protein
MVPGKTVKGSKMAYATNWNSPICVRVSECSALYLGRRSHDDQWRRDMLTAEFCCGQRLPRDEECFIDERPERQCR